MKNITCISLIVSTLVTTAFADVNTMFHNAKVKGQIRTLHSFIDSDSSENVYATVLGGSLKYELTPYNGFNGAAKFVTTKNITPLSGEDENYNDALSSQKGEYTQLVEGYMNYKFNTLNVRVGRQNIDTPLADSDDIAMVANTFEAVDVSYMQDVLSLEMGYLREWQGADVGLEDPWLTTGKDGTYFLGLSYSTCMFETNFWLYNINGEKDDEIANNSIYTDAILNYEIQNIKISTALQYLQQVELDSSGIESSIYGISSEIGVKDITFSFAYNKSLKQSQKQSFSGFGGGTLFTNMDSMIVDAISADRDADALVVGFGYEYKGINFSYAYGDFNGDKDSQAKEEHIVEQDLSITYNYKDINIEAIYAQNDDTKNTNSNDGDWKNLRVLVKYDF